MTAKCVECSAGWYVPNTTDPERALREHQIQNHPLIRADKYKISKAELHQALDLLGIDPRTCEAVTEVTIKNGVIRVSRIRRNPDGEYLIVADSVALEGLDIMVDDGQAQVRTL